MTIIITNESIELKEFDMSQIGVVGKNILLLGKRGTGKTTIAIDYFLQNKDKFCNFTCISPTEDLNNNYSNLIPSHSIFRDFDPELVKNYSNSQMSNGLLIMDDCIILRRNDKEYEAIRNALENRLLTNVIADQVQHLNPLLREKSDYIFVLKQPMRYESDKIYKCFGGMFPNYEVFKKYLNKATGDYGALVIDNTSISDKIEDRVYFYRSKKNEQLIFV